MEDTPSEQESDEVKVTQSAGPRPQNLTPVQFFDGKGRSDTTIRSREEQLAEAFGSTPGGPLNMTIQTQAKRTAGAPDGQMSSDPKKVSRPVHPSERKPRRLLSAPAPEEQPPAPAPEEQPPAEQPPAEVATIKGAAPAAKSAAEGDDLPF